MVYSSAEVRTKNFEAVVETQIIDGKPGPPRAVAIYLWWHPAPCVPWFVVCPLCGVDQPASGFPSIDCTGAAA